EAEVKSVLAVGDELLSGVVGVGRQSEGGNPAGGFVLLKAVGQHRGGVKDALVEVAVCSRVIRVDIGVGVGRGHVDLRAAVTAGQSEQHRWMYLLLDAGGGAVDVVIVRIAVASSINVARDAVAADPQSAQRLSEDGLAVPVGGAPGGRADSLG